MFRQNFPYVLPWSVCKTKSPTSCCGVGRDNIGLFAQSAASLSPWIEAQTHPKSRNTKRHCIHTNFFEKFARTCLLPCAMRQESNGNCSEKLVQMNFFGGGFSPVDFLLWPTFAARLTFCVLLSVEGHYLLNFGVSHFRWHCTSTEKQCKENRLGRTLNRDTKDWYGIPQELSPPFPGWINLQSTANYY